MDRDAVDSFMDGLPPMSDKEKFEALLGYFNGELKHLSAAELWAFRDHVAEKHPGTAEETTVLEVIDGLLALRAIESDLT